MILIDNIVSYWLLWLIITIV